MAKRVWLPETSYDFGDFKVPQGCGAITGQKLKDVNNSDLSRWLHEYDHSDWGGFDHVAAIVAKYLGEGSFQEWSEPSEDDVPF